MIAYFVRHADKARGDFFNARLRHQDQPISRIGRGQAGRLARYLRRKEISSLYVSEYVRTAQTAKPLARKLGIQPVTDPRLNEIDIGSLEGLPDEEFRVRHPETWKAYMDRSTDFRWPGGETGQEAQQRIAAFLSEQPGRSGNIAAVAHDGIIRLLFCHIMKIPVSRRFELTLDTTGIMEIEWDVKRVRWNLVRYNQIPSQAFPARHPFG
jgi:broad specificity phosphatase PhoE